MRPGLRTHASATLRITYTTLVPANLRGRMREVSHFESKEPGKGHGAELLRQVCEEANRGNIVLMIVPTTEQLTAFYARHGFRLIQDEPALMIRTPQLFMRDAARELALAFMAERGVTTLNDEADEG